MRRPGDADRPDDADGSDGVRRVDRGDVGRSDRPDRRGDAADAHAGRLTVILVGIVADVALTLLKFAGYLLTGSPALLSEVYHSGSDLLNQFVLLFGLSYGRRRNVVVAGRAQFLYSYAAAVLFGIAGVQAVEAGYEALRHPGPVTEVGFSLFGAHVAGSTYGYAVLAAAVVFQLYSLRTASRHMAAQIRSHGWDGIVEAFTKTSDVTVLTSFVGDVVGVAGAAVALVGFAATQYTRDPVYGSVAAVVVGCLLVGFAFALALENERLVLGEGVGEEETERLRAAVAESAGVREVQDFRTVYVGPERVIVTANVVFDPSLSAADLLERIDDIEDALLAEHPDVWEMYIEPRDGARAPSRDDERR